MEFSQRAVLQLLLLLHGLLSVEQAAPEDQWPTQGGHELAHQLSHLAIHRRLCPLHRLHCFLQSLCTLPVNGELLLPVLEHLLGETHGVLEDCGRRGVRHASAACQHLLELPDALAADRCLLHGLLDRLLQLLDAQVPLPSLLDRRLELLDALRAVYGRVECRRHASLQLGDARVLCTLRIVGKALQILRLGALGLLGCIPQPGCPPLGFCSAAETQRQGGRKPRRDEHAGALDGDLRS
mmetsp:Transcript_61507/g.170542  ORF Transcript_61507/g.170542 Transcript_61507/m.170542 type:complete len:239 (-) Transcript_61507:262-978(-)